MLKNSLKIIPHGGVGIKLFFFSIIFVCSSKIVEKAYSV